MKKIVSVLLAFVISLQIFTLSATAAAPTVDDYVKNAVEEITKIVTPEMTDLEKVTVLYDWMTHNVKYELYSVGSAYEALVLKETKCSGYASGFNRLLTAVGIESGIVGGKLGGIGHSWNMVNLGGKWYHVDATNENPGQYKRFLMSDTWARSNGYSFDYGKTTPKSSYGGTEIRDRSFFAPLGDSIYYIKIDKKTLYRYNSVTKKTTTLATNVAEVKTMGGYLIYRDYKADSVYGDEFTHTFYEPKTDTKVTHMSTGVLDAIVGTTALYVITERLSDDTLKTYISALDISTQKTQRSKTLTQTAGDIGINYAGTYENKMYFYSWFDLFCYDTSKNTFSKLRRPDDIVPVVSYTDWPSMQYINKAEIIEKKGTAYLKWIIELAIPDPDDYYSERPTVTRTRKIS